MGWVELLDQNDIIGISLACRVFTQPAFGPPLLLLCNSCAARFQRQSRYRADAYDDDIC